MATLYSTQITALEYTNPATRYPAAQWTGKVRVKCFDWTGDAAQNDYVQLCKLPKGARILRGYIDFTDFGASVTLDIGDGTTENKYASAIDVATAAGQGNFANTWALYGYGREALASDIYLTAKLEGANPDSGTLRGYVEYMVE